MSRQDKERFTSETSEKRWGTWLALIAVIATPIALLLSLFGWA